MWRVTFIENGRVMEITLPHYGAVVRQLAEYASGDVLLLAVTITKVGEFSKPKK